MNRTEKEIQNQLSHLPLGGLQYFETVGSSNDIALAWAAQGANDFSLVFADEQTAGRGRSNRKWYTPAGSALAFSLILRPFNAEQARVGLFAGLGAVALVQTLAEMNISAKIKWPNDVLVNGKKIAGILTEAVWVGEQVENLIVGMGVNVHPQAVPPETLLSYPATCIQAETEQPIERIEVLSKMLAKINHLREDIASDDFLLNWENNLAFRGETVQVWQDGETPVTGKLDGLEAGGALRLKITEKDVRVVHYGEIHLRPL